MRNEAQPDLETAPADTAPRLIFLHSAASHVPGFEDLVTARAPALARAHCVAPDLLDLARRSGEGPELRQAMRKQIAALAAGPNDLVLCSCSTLGAEAETSGRELGVRVLRLDRALAEAAIARGRRIALLAALDSTAGPTLALFREVATALDASPEITFHLAPGAWPHFEAGDLAAYHAAIEAAARALAPSCDLLVLVQASMAPVVDALEDLPVPVLASPKLGIERALELLEAAA